MLNEGVLQAWNNGGGSGSGGGGGGGGAAAGAAGVPDDGCGHFDVDGDDAAGAAAVGRLGPSQQHLESANV